jgi:hypothetical protein
LAEDLETMKPSEKWIDDWKIGLEPRRENQVAAGLVEYFFDFWDKAKLEEKSKKTRNRYGSALHALGGYLVEKAISEEDADKTAHELLLEYVYEDEGPLVYHDNFDWQDELDMVCRKFYKYLKPKR